MKRSTLVICFNQFRGDGRPFSYVEVIEDTEDMSCEIIELKRKPRTARFDEVMETGEGSYNSWNAHKATKLYHHELLKTGGAL